MHNKIPINNTISLDLPRLLSSRLLIQANSGGGKSWLIRRLLEQSHGKVQQIVIDLEGEFSTLREKYDYILAAKEGDTPVDPKSAALLARKILELNVSAIIDLYELNPYDRKLFVKNFLTAMVNAPKELWHECLVVVDEAHEFCPEKGQSEAMGAVIDLATRGRKRGFCAVLATQRISKLHKDAAAECNNKLIGRAGLDVDMKRASEELGFTSKEQMLSLRRLKPGEFYAFGVALSDEVIKLSIGNVKTSHPSISDGRVMKSTPTPPTAKIRVVLQQLADLPEEAKKEAHTIADLTKENQELRTKLIMSDRQVQKTTELKDVMKHPEFVGLSMQHNNLSQKYAALSQYTNQLAKTLQQIDQWHRDLRISKILSSGTKLHYVKPESDDQAAHLAIHDNTPHDGFSRSMVKESEKYTIAVHQAAMGRVDEIRKYQYPKDQNIKAGAKRMLDVLVSNHPIKLTKSQLATQSGMAARGGTFGTYLSNLKSSGLVATDDDLIFATDEGVALSGVTPSAPSTPKERIELWRKNLKAGCVRMLDVLVSMYPDTISKEQLAIDCGMEMSGGTFGTYLSILRSNGLVTVRGREIKVSDDIYA